MNEESLEISIDEQIPDSPGGNMEGDSSPAEAQPASPQEQTIKANHPKTLRKALEQADAKASSKVKAEKAPKLGYNGVPKAAPIDKTDLQSQEATTEEGKAEKPITPPVSWTNEDKEHFKTLPRNVQEVIARREAEREKGLTSKVEKIAQKEKELERFRSNWGDIERTFNPHMEELALRGVTPAQFMSSALAIDKMLTRNPIGGVLHLCKQLNIHPQQLLQAQQPQNPIDPKLQAIEQRLTRYELAEQQKAQQAQRAYAGNLNNQILEFRNAKDEQGNLLRPYLGDVETHMASLIGAMRKTNPNMPIAQMLQDAYDQATWAHPEIRQRLLEQQKAQERAQSAARVNEAKRAASSLTGSPNGVMKPAPKDIRSAVEMAFAMHSN